MRRIGICTPHVAHRDAVGNDVIGMYQVLQEAGSDVRIFASGSEVADPHVYALADAGRFLSTRGDVLIYHHSVGWDQGLALLKGLSCVKIVRYHNMTPPEFFAGVAANYEAACRSGRSQLHDIARIGIDLYLLTVSYPSPI